MLFPSSRCSWLIVKLISCLLIGISSLAIVDASCSSRGKNVPPSSSVTRTPLQIPTAFTLTMMGSRRGKGGNLKRSLGDSSRGVSSTKSINSGRGQEITGVTLPEQGKVKGWAFGADKTIACANVGGRYYGIDGTCPRCAFDLFKGKLLLDKDVWGPDPTVACPTCGVTYSMRTGKFGPEYKATGLAGFVNTWAKTATVNNASQDVPAYIITRDEQTGKVYCRDR